MVLNNLKTRKLISNFARLLTVFFLLDTSTLSRAGSLGSSSDSVQVPTSNKPKVGAYSKNFKGAITAVLSETGDSEVTLPHLNVEDNFYFGRTIQLNCNASYPVQWIYRGNGVSRPVVSSNLQQLVAREGVN